jgi:putative membrane-bound dehydrogenase-like protein
MKPLKVGFLALPFVVMLLRPIPTGALADAPKKPPAVKSPLSPQEALKNFKITPGLRIELVAAEPQIESPVAMTFDEDGKLWVVEMRDYPNGPGKGKKPQGRIRVLEDKDGDGFYESSTIFADNLLFANGVLRWRDGVVVTAAPYIVHLRDLKGTGKADRRDVLYEGFAAQNPQLRVSHPNLGIDNWVYAANGLRGGKVKPAHSDGKPIDLSNKDFRFDLISGKYEAISGPGQFGNTFDDWGNRFICDNRHHLRHVVMPDGYLKRNPSLAANVVVEDISELDEGPLYSGGKVYPISSNWTTSSLHEGRFTAACGVFIYRGNLLPKEYRGCAFTCEPTGNLVHQEILTPHGATFKSRPAKKGVEFLATPDDWFRPVFLTSGPDGALYVVDMYRAVIEHPEFMPPELQKRPDLTLGKDKGRIWRIVPEGKQKPRPKPNLSKASTNELVALLENDDAWWRTTAQRLLLQRQDKSAIAELRGLARKSRKPLARAHAVWLLRSLGAGYVDETIDLLNDRNPRVREHAVLLAEGDLSKDILFKILIKKLAKDPDARVRFQVALSLGEWENDAIIPPLAHIALAGVDGRWTRLAVASAVPKRAGLLLTKLLAGKLTDGITPNRLLLVQELATLVGARQDSVEIEGTMTALSQIDTQDKLAWQMAGINGLTDGLGRRGQQLEAILKTLPSIKNVPDPRETALVKWLDGLLGNSVAVAVNDKAGLSERLAAIRLLAHASWSTAEPKLVSLLNNPVQDVRLAAVRSLAAHNQPDVSKLLMKHWRSTTPAVRREVLEAMLRQTARITVLLDEVEAKRVKPGDIDPLRTRLLLNHGNPEIRDRAKKLLRDNLPGNRKLVVARYQEALKLKGDAKLGREIFKKNCATCHKVAGIGVDVGPDIGDTRTKTLGGLLVDILDPNQAIDNNAISYLVTTKSGKSLTGLIAAENASSITLRRAEGQTDVILRQDIDRIVSTGESLMPEGFEKTISIREMADLLSFLKNWRYLDGNVPLGK